jgi:hypothetical protein
MQHWTLTQFYVISVLYLNDFKSDEPMAMISKENDLYIEYYLRRLIPKEKSL